MRISLSNKRTWACVVAASAAMGCGGGGGTSNPIVDADPATPDADITAECPRELAAADRLRKVVVARPYDTEGNQSARFDILNLMPTGELVETTDFVELGAASYGTVEFTPDGEIGIVVEDDGTLGVLRFDGSNVSVVHASFAGSFYADSVRIAPDGASAWVVDRNTSGPIGENGGGIYKVAIGCDGTLTDLGRVVELSTPVALAQLESGGFVTAGGSVVGATDDVQLIGSDYEVVATARAFPGDDVILGSGALVDNIFIVGAVNEFTETANQVTAVQVGATTLTALADRLTIEDPIAIVGSPFGDAALVVSGFGDALEIIEVNPSGAAVLTAAGEVAYAGARPQLPNNAVGIRRGALNGHVLVAELQSIRQLAFDGEGGIDDLGSLSGGDGLETILGAIGVQP